MKTVLCYGDSLTWGYHPETGERIGINKRWPGVLRNEMGSDYQIIEEGLNGRTTVWDDPLLGGYKNGMKYLLPCLSSHRPIDLVILFLGSNDLKTCFSLSPSEIADGIRVLINIILKSESGTHNNPPKILLVSPPNIKQLSNFKDEFEHGKLKSLKLNQYYMEVAEEYDIEFLDAAEIVNASNIDGIHLDIDEHLKLGFEMTKIVKEILK
jgi:lysophospholipase L1-like esterase